MLLESQQNRDADCETRQLATAHLHRLNEKSTVQPFGFHTQLSVAKGSGYFVLVGFYVTVSPEFSVAPIRTNGSNFVYLPCLNWNTNLKLIINLKRDLSAWVDNVLRTKISSTVRSIQLTSSPTLCQTTRQSGRHNAWIVCTKKSPTEYLKRQTMQTKQTTQDERTAVFSFSSRNR